MEVVLTRLRDFSCKEASFEDYKAAVVFRKQPPAEETCRDESVTRNRAGRLDIESALAWLRRELVEMRSQDQALIRQLMDLHAGIQELKQECILDDDEEAEEEEEEEPDDYEEHSWDSDGEAEGSSASSCSEGMSFCSSIYSNFYTSPLGHSLSKKTCGRRSSVP